MTARERAIKALQENPDGLSRAQLKKEVGGNAGAFRRLLQSMVDRGEVLVREEYRPNCGPTKVHTLGEVQPQRRVA